MSIKKPEVGGFTRELLRQMTEGNLSKSESRPKKAGSISVQFADPNTTTIQVADGETPTLAKSLLNVLNGGPGHTVERLAFETNPSVNNTYAAIFRNKIKLLPDTFLKRIAIQDSLVAAIVNARAAMIQSFGRPQPDRHSTGFKIEPLDGLFEKMDEAQKADFQKRVDTLQKKIVTCGSTANLKADDHMTFAQFLGMCTRNAVVVGRVAVEVISALNEQTGEMEVHSYRPIDAGTIYKAAPYKEAAQSVRESALGLMEQIKNKDFIPEKFTAEEYSWIQVIEGHPVQAFTASECLVYNFYPVTDVELDGYPLTPIDTAISDIITHINITNHNKLYFQTGRAARGMLVVKSEDVNEHVISNIKQQFNASINSVANAWRMPVFGVGAEDEISWVPIDSGSRDMEFQYLSDSNSRVILSAFQMSPEELPGYAHLSRGTNNQALSESNNEYKMEAARDVGLRPLVSNFEDFFNARILPLLDPVLAKICVIKFVGLDSETSEKESIRLQGDSALHMTYDEVHEAVEKEPVGMSIGGAIPLNPAFQQLLDKYFTVGQILERFCGIKGATKDPQLAYFRDPFWFQFQQLQQQAQQMQMQQQQAQQAQAQGLPPPGQGGGGGGPPGSGGGDSEDSSGGQGASGGPQAGGGNQGDASEGSTDGSAPGGSQDAGEDLSRSIEQVMDLLSKSDGEKHLPPSRRRLLHQQDQTVKKFMASLEKDLQDMSKDVLDIAKGFVPKE